MNGMNSFTQLVRRSFGKIIAAQGSAKIADFEKIDDTLTPNMRALRLVMTMADQLSSMGMPAHSVTNLALNITDVYCQQKVHIDISYTQIFVSQDRGIDREPLTLIRTITPRETNYQLMQQLQDLSAKIANHTLTLDDAEKSLDKILSRVRRYPRWVIYIASGGISAGSAVLYSATWPLVLIAFFVGTVTAWLLGRLGRLALPPFFTQVVASLFITLFASALMWFVSHGYVDFMGSVNPTLITVGGIVLLVAGMAIVGAFQDAIDEYYVTAGARLLRVAMMTTGIVAGVGIGLYASRKLGISFIPTPDRLTFASASYQYLGAVIISASFALGNHTRLGGIILTGATGLLGYYTFLASSGAGLSSIPANALAGITIGFIATLVSRVWHMPSLAIVNASIVPLVPGLILYNGLMGLIAPENAPGGDDLLLRAILISVAIAAGASFGVLVGRPTRRSFVLIRNSLPQWPLRSEDRE